MFLPAATVTTLLHVDVGVSDGTLLWVVCLSGTFRPWSLSRCSLGWIDAPWVMIFEAETGNLLTESLG